MEIRDATPDDAAAIAAIYNEGIEDKLVLAAFPWNSAGMRLCEKHGFRTVGTYREHGQLDGRWVDVVVMEKVLGEPPAA